MQRRITVIPGDKTISIDGVAIRAAFSMDSKVRALQWDGEQGHIEYSDDRSHCALSPAMFKQYVAPFIEIWERAVAAKDADDSVVFTRADSKQQEIIDKADAALRECNQHYSACEMDSWPLQEAGARIICGCEECASRSLSMFVLMHEELREQAVQLVERLAVERKMNPQEFSKKVIGKADRAALYSATIYAEQRSYKARLQELVELDDEALVEAMEIIYSNSEGFDQPMS